MLFNSNEFIFVFLPAVLAGFFLIQRIGGARAGVVWLALGSVAFYGYWRAENLIVFLGSIAVNFVLGRLITRRRSRGLLVAGIVFNVALLGYYKYVNFFLDQWNALAGSEHHLAGIVLPIGISFFTFQQMAFLIDASHADAKPARFFDYVLFVSFFPQLIAGPIVHHREMMPQFAEARTRRFDATNMAFGLTIFAVGLFKKVIIADGVADYATPVFAGPHAGGGPDFFTAWGAALAYTFQIYFDFSGYCDMAIGLGRMFNIRLPLNFDSPYKATSIIDFWRRWHMTLSRFLRDYLYYPLGGNRRGLVRRYVNLVAVMVIGGLWHGAAWTFVLWGTLHGFYLLVNHSWRFLAGRRPAPMGSRPYWTFGARTVTFVAVVIAWVLFRAESLEAAWIVYRGMLGLNGATVPIVLAPVAEVLRAVSPALQYTQTGGYQFVTMVATLLVCAVIAHALPDTTDLVRAYDRHEDATVRAAAGDAPPVWRPGVVSAAAAGLMLFMVFKAMNSGTISEFIYFQF